MCCGSRRRRGSSPIWHPTRTGWWRSSALSTTWVIVSGKRNGIEAQRLTVRKYNDGFTHYPQFEFPNFILPTDIEKLNQFIA